MHFSEAIQAKLAIFSPYSNLNIVISSDLFVISSGTVRDFLDEISQTCVQVIAQSNTLSHTEFYAQKLVQQFDLLKTTVERYTRTPTHNLPKFKSGYRFAKNLANLPPCKQREEFQKALRALNEKISWLIAQSQTANTLEHKAIYQKQIQETEFRKQKCLKALDELK